MQNFEGWDVIDGLLSDRYGRDAKRLEWHAPVPYRPVGPLPMGGFVTHSIAIYPRDEPVPHWHLISYALTAPYEERGYEFTVRVRRRPGETEAPNWALALLEGLSSYVSRSDNDLAVGHYMEYPYPIDQDRPDSKICAGGFVHDPELTGSELKFLQFVGITADELEAAQAWDVKGLILALEPHLPMLITDLDRSSLADVPGVADAVRNGALLEGSATGYLFFQELEADIGEGVRLRLCTQYVRQFTQVLPGRTPHGHPLILTGGRSKDVVFLSGPEFGYQEAERALEITLPGPASVELAAAIGTEPGDYRVASLPGLTVTVVP